MRILQNGETIVRNNNHPIVGAIIGHALIGGATGTIIGAAAGSGDKTATQTNELKACEIYIEVNGTTHKFLTTSGDYLLSKCALAEPGDPAFIQVHALSSNGKVERTFTSWEYRYNTDSCYSGCTPEER